VTAVASGLYIHTDAVAFALIVLSKESDGLPDHWSNTFRDSAYLQTLFKQENYC